MEAASVEVEGLSAAQGMLLAVADQHDAAFDDIAEFLAVMRLDREALAALGQLEQYRLHLILLRVGNDPVDRAVLALVNEEIVGVEDELVVFILLKELGKIRAERLQNVAQRVDGRGRALTGTRTPLSARFGWRAPPESVPCAFAALGSYFQCPYNDLPIPKRSIC